MGSGKKLACLIVIIIVCIIGYNAIKATSETINAFKVSQSPSETVGIVTDISTKTTVHKSKHRPSHSSLKYYATIMYSVNDQLREKPDVKVDSRTKTGDRLTVYFHPDAPDLIYLEQPGFGLLAWDVIIVLVMYALTVSGILVLRRIYHSEHVASERQMDRLVKRAQMRQQELDRTDVPKTNSVSDNSGIESSYGDKEPWEL